MLTKEKKLIINISDFNPGCPLFKRYCENELWSGESHEYMHIEYAREYLQIYIHCWINIFILERFGFLFIALMYNSPRFRKFLVSGFFKYLDSDFLSSLKEKSFSPTNEGKIELKLFLNSSFKNSFKERLEKDILVLLIELINDILIKDYLTSSLMYIKKNMYDMKLDNVYDKILYDLPACAHDIRLVYLPCREIDLFCKGMFYAKKFVLRKKKYSYELRRFFPFSDIEMHRRCEIRLENIKSLKDSLMPLKINNLKVNSSFFEFPYKDFYPPNKDVQDLIECVPDSKSLNKLYVGLQTISDSLVEDSSPEEDLVFESFIKNLDESYNNNFVDYENKLKDGCVQASESLNKLDVELQTISNSLDEDSSPEEDLVFKSSSKNLDKSYNNNFVDYENKLKDKLS